MNEPGLTTVTLTAAEAQALYAMSCVGLTVLKLDDVPSGYEAIGKLAAVVGEKHYPGSAGRTADAVEWNHRQKAA